MRLYALFALLTAIDWVSAVTLRSATSESAVLGMTFIYAVAIASGALLVALLNEKSPWVVFDDIKSLPVRTTTFIVVLGLMYAAVRYIGDSNRDPINTEDIITRKNVVEMAIAAVGYTVIGQRTITAPRLIGVALLPIAAWLID